MQRKQPGMGPFAVALSMALLATACGPSPSPSPTGAVGRFQAMMTAHDLNLTSGIRGTYALSGDQTYPIWGALAIDGADSRILTSMEGPFGIDAWEQVTQHGQTSTRRGSEPWTTPSPTSDATSGLAATLGDIDSLEDLGLETVDGRSLRHVQALGLPLDPTDLGIEATGTDTPATLDAWLDEDGKPVTMRLAVGPLTLDLDGVRLDEAAPIQAPYEVKALESPALHYVVILPKTSDVRVRGTSGHLIGLDGAYVITYCAAGSMKLPNWVTEGTVLYSGLWGAQPEASESLVLRSAAGSTPATLSTWHGTAEGQAAYILDLAIVADNVACDVQWFSPPGDEASDRARFEQLLAGFRLGG